MCLYVCACVICLAWIAFNFVCLCHVYFLRVVLFAARKKWTPECLLTFTLFIREFAVYWHPTDIFICCQ